MLKCLYVVVDLCELVVLCEEGFTDGASRKF